MNTVVSTSALPSQPPRLLEQVRARIKVLRYSIRTEQTYVDWIKRYIRFFDKQHPRELSAVHVERFLSHLVSEIDGASSMQSQAKAALLFLYKEVLQIELLWPDGVKQSGTREWLPVKVGGVEELSQSAAYVSAALNRGVRHYGGRRPSRGSESS